MSASLNQSSFQKSLATHIADSYILLQIDPHSRNKLFQYSIFFIPWKTHSQTLLQSDF